MRITREQVEHVAMLARLELSGQEVGEYTRQLDAILEYAAVLEELKTEEIEPTAHVMPLMNVMREDSVRASLSQDQVLRNAPDAENGFFRVPKIV
ncbi:MAG: Asp-tRNA(Asn)/Glu-tRNA(Gln) amidotransferase subunit GatC [Peptococcaceae bacterium]|jgi:aspartyl-tRNA(Asn)/glutamyl-tRNA(Gln) amidotransferase subunit C|nr:Asp-tRNA(Asn)/Glu-tRNA(Gln) amidotransferase subunit GatC [Peptococcaceae bacterium]